MATIKEMQTELDEKGVTYPKGKNAAFYEGLLSGDAPDIPEAERFEFINKGERNYFTEGGRCRPGHTVFLSNPEAEQYKNLERV